MPRDAAMTEESHAHNIIAGILLGGLCGGGLGLGACMFIFDDPPFFTGDTILIGAVLCGALGYFLGAGFIEWLKKTGGAFGKCRLDNQAIVMATCQGLLLLIPYRIRLSGRNPNNSSP